MSKQSYVDMQIEDLAKEQEISIPEAAQQVLKNSDHVVDFDNLPTQNHSWTDRGLKYTCENAGHLYHEAWKVRKAVI